MKHKILNIIKCSVDANRNPREGATVVAPSNFQTKITKTRTQTAFSAKNPHAHGHAGTLTGTPVCVTELQKISTYKER